ncbi:unnamed protein product [Coffea canephora]|uniref:Basic blue protein n=1 Tax=Coffea canephora TaxID=49390 RepID=A0A068U6C6_COFCA|nr:unnamed protein product [Coffea canephora]
MYVQGRSSARQATAFAVLMILLSLFSRLRATQATTYAVGDSSGWNFNMGNWTEGKRFNAGDILTFNYDSSLHNVVMVDAKGYENCTASSKAKIYNSGNDKIKLSRGRYYFICTFPGHCDGGLKIQLSAY